MADYGLSPVEEALKSVNELRATEESLSQVLYKKLIPDRLQIQDITPNGYPGYVTKSSWPAYLSWMTYAQRIQQVMHEREVERANLEEVISCATWNRLRKKWACKHPGGAWPADPVQDEEC